MIEAGGADLRWDVGHRWRRRAAADATVVATNGGAMLVRVALHPDLHIGSRVEIELAGGRGEVAIRHVAPTGDREGVALVGVELVDVDRALADHVAALAARPGEDGAHDRWWWQRGP